MSGKIYTKLYLNRSKDDNWYEAQKLGLSEEAARNFAYCGYEVELEITIDPETGETYATHVKGVKLEQPIKLT